MNPPAPRLTAIPVFFRPEQVAPREAVLSSPSTAKPEPVVESWKALGIPLDIRSFEPLSTGDFSPAHDRGYVRRVLSLEEANGFGNRSEEVARSLPFTSGSFVAAALEAWRSGGATVSPTSGFHHAGHAYGGGFCTFNGLAVAAVKLVRAGVRRCGILDCDAHFGDGTADILDTVPGLEGKVEHFTRGVDPYRGDRANVPRFLARLPELLEEWKRAGVEVVLYQAGADPHVDDPVGCRFLTTDELLARDRAVFSACARLGLPVAWNLAGGYQEDRRAPWPESIRKVLEVHDNTMRACAEAFLVRA
jgi:acetoin utilization deacetylase AcuC-like enzyme